MNENVCVPPIQQPGTGTTSKPVVDQGCGGGVVLAGSVLGLRSEPPTPR